MWVTKSFNTAAVDDPAVYFDEPLLERLRALSDEELVALDLAVSAHEDHVMAALEAFVEDDPGAFEHVPLPERHWFRDEIADDSLSDLLIGQIDEAPLRWRYDLLEVVSQYVTQYGPSYRKWKRLVRRQKARPKR